MNMFCRTVICGLLAVPTVAAAEVEFGGQAVLGYGEVDGEGESYGIIDLNLSNSYTFDSGVALNWDIRARARTDQDDIGQVDDDNFDISVEADFGAAGKIGLSTFNTIDQFPWADGELFNRGSVGVFPVIRKRYDGVADSQFQAGTPPPLSEKVDPDLLLTYSNQFGKLGLDIVVNALGTWDEYEESEMLDAVATSEAKLTLPTDYGIYSVQYNNLDDAEFQVVVPLRDIGLTLIGRHSINEGDWDDARTNLVMMYRAQDLGLFKGAMLAHAFDDENERTMLNLNFGDEAWEFKIAGDSDGDLAVEGNYAFTEQAAIQFGWDNGHGAMQGFDDEAFPAPVFAPARGDAFEVALVYTF